MRQSFHKACYQATWEEWLELAQWLALHGEKRLASTITRALDRQKRLAEGGFDYTWQLKRNNWGLCFRDGSIAKIVRWSAQLQSMKSQGYYELIRDRLIKEQGESPC